jgi:hypothetical protein
VIIGVSREIKAQEYRVARARHESGEAATVELTFPFAVKMHDKTLPHVGQSFVNHHAVNGLDCALRVVTRFRQITASQ